MSSVRLVATFDTGSGEVLTAARKLALTAWLASALTPPVAAQNA